MPIRQVVRSQVRRGGTIGGHGAYGQLSISAMSPYSASRFSVVAWVALAAPDRSFGGDFVSFEVAFLRASMPGSLTSVSGVSLVTDEGFKTIFHTEMSNPRTSTNNAAPDDVTTVV